MKKKLKVINVCCANCAAKMEERIRKIDGVKAASMNFLTQKLILEAEDERFDEIIKEADACIRKIEADAYIDL